MSDLGNKEIFAKNLKYYMDYYEKDRTDICDDLGIPYTTFADWYNAVTYPRIDNIELLANYFNIQKSDLIENKYKNDKELDETDVLFYKYKDVLSESDKNIIKAVIEERKRKIDKELGEDN